MDFEVTFDPGSGREFRTACLSGVHRRLFDQLYVRGGR